jgi:hypothetical protein
MQNAETTAPARARARLDPHHPSARRPGGDARGSRRPVPDHDDPADARLYSAPGVCMIIPVAAALAVTCALSPAMTFVMLRSKGYSRTTASLGVATGPLGVLAAIAAPSHLPAS